MILIIDNYDSFTWNLVQRIWELDDTLDVHVVRNDQITADDALALRPERVIVSPGPCTPTEAGVSNDIVTAFAGLVPILGVCLGHQCIGFAQGLDVVRHHTIMHGKTSEVHHDDLGIFEGLSNPFVATRYHSLVIKPSGALPEGWAISAWTFEPGPDGREERVIMGLRKVGQGQGQSPVDGVQFHPESFLTDEGPLLLANFLGLPRPVLAQVHSGA